MFSTQRILKKTIKISTKPKTLSNTMFYIQYIYHVVNPSLSVFLTGKVIAEEQRKMWWHLCMSTLLPPAHFIPMLVGI